MIRSPYEEMPPTGDGTNETAATKKPSAFAAWGESGKVAEDEGWYPVVIDKDRVEYRSKYDNQFNQVVIPNDKARGYISVVGSKGGKMTVLIKKADGTVDRTLLKDVSPQDVDAFFTSNFGTIKRRADSIQAGTNSDAMAANGTYVPLK